MLKISKQSDYGLVLLSYLKDKKGYIPLSQIIKDTDLPLRFLARIASNLKKYGILQSIEGKTGGYKITSKIKNITVYDYLKIFEKNLFLTSCSKEEYKCPYEEICQHKDFFKNKLKNLIIRDLKKYKLKDIL